MNNEILEILKREKPFLEKEFGVEEIGLFGSYARGNPKPESDIDILVKVREVNYKKLIRLLLYLESKFSKKVDLIRNGPHLTERFFKLINKDIIYA